VHLSHLKRESSSGLANRTKSPLLEACGLALVAQGYARGGGPARGQYRTCLPEHCFGQALVLDSKDRPKEVDMALTSGATSPFVNVADFGAAGDGTSDDTAAIRRAIDAAAPAQGPTGNTVFLPAGRYRLSAGLVLPPAVSLVGAGWNTPGSQANVFAGSWLLAPAGAPWSPLTLSGSGASVRNVAFNVPDQSVPPAPAEPMVRVTANNALVEDILLYNPFAGIYLDGGAQATLRRIWGQPLYYGVMVDRSQDSNYIDTVHFWTYWQPPGTPGAAWQLSHGTGILLLRADNPHLSNVFAFHYLKGLVLGSSQAGAPHKVHLFNADFDNCVTGVHVAAPGREGYAATMQMANVTVQSPSGAGAPAGHGVWVDAASSFAMVQASNLRVSSSALNAVRIDAEDASFFGENVSLENFRGPEGFRISSPRSFAHLGVGFRAGPGVPFAPKSQFRFPKT